MSTVSDLDTWRLFFKVVAKGSIAKVAEEMRIEPSSISRRLNKLESELGTDLFQRRGKNLVLTAAGSLACCIAEGKSSDQIAFISSVFSQLGDTLATIAAQRDLSSPGDD